MPRYVVYGPTYYLIDVHTLYCVIVFWRGKFFYKVGRTKNTPAKRYSRGPVTLIKTLGTIKVHPNKIRRSERLLKRLTEKKMGCPPTKGNEYWAIKQPEWKIK